MPLRIVAGACAVALGLSALGLSGPVMAADSSAYSKGGKTKEFAKDVGAYKKSGEQFRIKGHCQSACTMFLALPNACVEPSATLLFHAGKTPDGTARMLDSYNSSLRAYLEANGVMKSPKFHSISGATIISKFGYKRCG